MGPCQIEYAICQMRILVFLDQSQHGVARVANAGDNIDGRGFARIDCHALPDSHDGIQNRACSA